MRSMVEGTFSAEGSSTALRAVPLPVPGRISGSGFHCEINDSRASE